MPLWALGIGGLISVLTGCRAGSGGTPVASPSPPIASDNVRFGGGFYPLETFNGSTFRWVNNNAELVICGSDDPRRLSIDVEPGPSLGAKSAVLSLHDAAGHSHSYTIASRKVISLKIPASGTEMQRVTLHVQSHDVAVAHEKRILNLRVFKISLNGFSPSCQLDITDSANISLGQNWYALESTPAGSFRWVNNDAQIKLGNSTHARELFVEAEPGPGQAGQPLRIEVRSAKGAEIGVAKRIVGREVVSILLPPSSGGTRTILLHTAEGGENIPTDTRTLNFRVFSLRVSDALRSASTR